MTPLGSSRIPTALTSCLRSVRRWLRLRDGLLLASRTLWLALGGVVAVLVAGRLWPIEGLLRWALAPLAVWLLAVGGYSLLRPLPLDEVARRTDRMLRLKERLSTALELAMEGATGPLVKRQQVDALWVAGRIVPRRDIRLTADRPALKRAAALLLVAVALAVWPNPMDAVLRQRAAVRAEAQEQARRVEELREELRRETTPTSKEREELLRRLAELARALRENPGSAEQALADISRTEATLRGLLDPQTPTRRAMLEHLAAQLHQLATQPSNHPATEPSLNTLADALADLNPEQQAALAQRLDQLAAQAATTDADLANALTALANAVRAGDAQAAAQATQSVQGALTRVQRDLDLQAALARALVQLQEGRTAIARAAQQDQTLAQGPGSGQGQGRGAGPGPVPSQNRGSGQGQGAGQGPPGSGGGTNARRLPPASRTGRAGEPQGPARRPDVGELERVYAPRLPGTVSDVEFVPGQQNPGGQTVTRRQRQPLPGQPGQATVPYRDVFPAFREAAAAALEREYIPPGLRDYVREYFSRLEP